MTKDQGPPPFPPLPGVDMDAFKLTDPAAFMQNMMKLVEESAKVATGYVAKGGLMDTASAGRDVQDTTKLLADVAKGWMSDPNRLMEAHAEFVTDMSDMWSNGLKRLTGEQTPEVAPVAANDPRFKHEDWSKNPYFDGWKQAYLLSSRWSEEMLARTPDLDEKTKARAQFMMRQMTMALSPTNFALTNPEVLREAFQTNGQSIVKGLENLSKDIANSGSMLKISQVDTDAFSVGGNIATTPGKVVFQNDLLQLIQYTPTTEKVHEVPFLIVPPWINKFYILDLTAERSFIRHLLDQGFTTFVVSWVNPDARHRAKTFEDYMREGILAAADAVKRETKAPKSNVLGYCIGGTLLGTTLAYLAQTGETPFNSASFLAAQLDFSDPGELKIFIDDEQIKAIEAKIDEKGYLDGATMALVFNMLRPRDLIWNYVVNNYLLGKKPMAFDLLYWNQDSTRLPGANHKFYLREYYLNNKLAKGELVMGGHQLDLGQIELPVYCLAARDDHIAPARSAFLGMKLLGGHVTYVMGGSGHIAGVINPPGKKIKYQFWTNTKPLSHPACATFDEWVAGAKETPGSWWPHFTAWLAKHSGKMITAKAPGTRLGTLEDAPGSYVKAKA